MWDHPERLTEALKAPHHVKTTCTITVPGGSPVEVEAEDFGTLSVDGGSRIRRRVSGLQLLGDSTTYALAATPGAIFAIQHGVSFGASEALVPVFYGEAQNPEQVFGGGSTGLSLVDHGTRLARCGFVAPFAPAAGTARTTAITAAIHYAIPTATVLNLSSDTGTVGSQAVWTSDPGDVLSTLSSDGGTDVYMRPDGVWVIVDKPTIATAPVLAISAGDGGTLKTAARTRPTDRMYNTVVVEPTAADGSQTWTPQVVQVTDPDHPRHPDKIGPVRYRQSAPTANSAAAALSIGRQRLDRVLGLTETLAIGAVAHPGLEANDSVRIVTSKVNTEPANIFQHYLDAFTIQFRSNNMRAATRSQLVNDA